MTYFGPTPSTPVAVAAKTADYTCSVSDNVILCSTVANAGFTIYLPTAIGITGRNYTIADGAGNCGNEPCVIDAYGSETINGQLTQSIDVAFESITVVSNGSGWDIVGDYNAGAYNLGTVTSVAVTANPEILVTGSPITTSGTIDLALDQSAIDTANLTNGAGFITANDVSTLQAVTKTADYTLTSDDCVVFGDTSSAASFTITLPTAVGITGRVYTLKDSGGNAEIESLILAADGSELIDGLSTQVINVNYESITVISNGTNWSLI